MKKILDQYGNIVTTFHYDEMSDTTIIHRVQDCEAILDRNKSLQTDDGGGPYEDFRHVASIPTVIYEKWLHEGMPRSDKRERNRFIQKKLNDPDWQYLKTAPKPRFRVGYGD